MKTKQNISSLEDIDAALDSVTIAVPARNHFSGAGFYNEDLNVLSVLEQAGYNFGLKILRTTPFDIGRPVRQGYGDVFFEMCGETYWLSQGRNGGHAPHVLKGNKWRRLETAGINTRDEFAGDLMALLLCRVGKTGCGRIEQLDLKRKKVQESEFRDDNGCTDRHKIRRSKKFWPNG